jgi:hypothetical protein
MREYSCSDSSPIASVTRARTSAWSFRKIKTYNAEDDYFWIRE